MVEREGLVEKHWRWWRYIAFTAFGLLLVGSAIYSLAYPGTVRFPALTLLTVLSFAQEPLSKLRRARPNTGRVATTVWVILGLGLLGLAIWSNRDRPVFLWILSFTLFVIAVAEVVVRWGKARAKRPAPAPPT